MLKTDNSLHQQYNKTHKGQSKKIEKRREQEKTREKERKEKKARRKEGGGRRIERYVGKLLRALKGNAEEVRELFGAMDEGAEVDQA